MVRSTRPLSTRAGVMIVTVLMLGAFGLRLWDVNQPSIWHDEGWSIRAIRDPIGTPDDNTPLVYYALAHLLWLGAGETPLALRYSSLLLAMLTLALAAQMVRRWADWEAAILAAMLLGVSPLLWAYAREIRAYAAVPLLTLVVLWLADWLLAPRQTFPWRIWIMLMIVELILLYTHNLSVTVVAWLNLVVGGIWTWQRRWKWMAIWLGGQTLVLIGYLPWILGQTPSGTALNTPPEVTPTLVWKIWQGYFAPLPTMIGTENALVIASAIFGAAAAACLITILTWNRNRHTLLVVSQAVLLPALATVEMLVANIDFHPRYYIAAVPATLMLVALGVNSLPTPWELGRLAIPAGMALATGVSAASLTALFDKPQYQHDDFHAIARYYATLPEGTIILIPYGWEPAIEEYYGKKLDLQVQILGIDLHSSTETAIQAINAAVAGQSTPVRIELMTWYQLPADLRGMYSCLLESAGNRVGDPVTVQGITTQGYTLSNAIRAAPISENRVNYGVLSLVQTVYGGTHSACVQTTWQLQQPTGSDWRVAGRVLTLDPAGWVIARSDTDLRQDDQTPTSEWKVGEHGRAFSLLRWPDGAPPGSYTVQVRVYSPSAPDGLDQLIDGIPAGKAVALGTIRPSHTTEVAFSNPPRHPLAATIVSNNEQIDLIGYDGPGGTLTPGQELRITLYWSRAADCCIPEIWSGARLVMRGEGWELAQLVKVYAQYSLDWHAFMIPADATGTVTLSLERMGEEPILLTTYTLEKTGHLFAPPTFDIPVLSEFVGLAVLEGFSVDQTTVTPTDTLRLTLVWKALSTPGTSYRVFTHLLNDQGRVIAQHDDYPVSSTRPTTGWVKGEYILDPYLLEFNTEGQSYRGPAHLEVGFYNPNTNTRVPLTGGGDYIILPIEIRVR